jgi:hypothetical protein
MESRRNLSNVMQAVEEKPGALISPGPRAGSLILDWMRRRTRNKKLPCHLCDTQYVGAKNF